MPLHMPAYMNIFFCKNLQKYARSTTGLCKHTEAATKLIQVVLCDD